MYINGLHFPIFFIFLNDDIKFKNAEEIIIKKNAFLMTNEDETNKNILDFINNSKGYEIYPFILNNFDYLIQSNIIFDKSKISSKFLKTFEFIILIKQFKINFIEIENCLVRIESIGVVNKTKFYSQLYRLLYKSFALKLGKVINYSDFEESKLFLNFNSDYNKFIKYSKEIENIRPNIIRNYDFKKNYVTSFFKSFGTDNEIDLKFKMETVKNHTDDEILNSFGKLIKETFVFNENVNAKTRNKLFKPIYKEINSAISQKTYQEKTSEALTKEVKRFLSKI